MKDIKKLLLIECLIGMLFCLLVAFLFSEDIAESVIALYAITWIPGMLVSTKIYNNIIDSINKES